MIKNCLVCNELFKTYPSKIKIGRGKYCSKECCLKITNKILENNGNKTRFKKGSKPHNFRGYTIKKTKNTFYKLIFMPEHPNCDNRGYVKEHRLVIEKEIGRYLTTEEEVHHKNYNGLDNNIDNLLLLSGADHKRIHLKDTVHKRWEKAPAE